MQLKIRERINKEKIEKDEKRGPVPKRRNI